LIFQHRDVDQGIGCDRMYVMAADGSVRQVSDGKGVTTCGYFLPDGKHVLYSSTRAYTSDCPPPLDYSHGYVWRVNPEYDVWLLDLATGERRRLTDTWGYDAETTISPLGDRMVFTSTRSGDLELWTSDLDGKNLFQVTDNPGYDGGAFFSHDGKRLVFRSAVFTPGHEAEEERRARDLLAQWLVQPLQMEIMLIDADGTNRQQVTHLGGANFAPYFFPGDQRIIFASNHHVEDARNFDLFGVGVDGQGLEQITTYEDFDAFPMFSPDGRWLIFSSNRGGSKSHETNLFVAAWR